MQKHFDPCDVECLLSLLESFTLVSPFTNLKLAWRTGTFVVITMPKYFADLTLLQIDNKHLSLHIMLLFSFLYLVVRQTNQVICHVRFVLNHITL